MPSTENQASQTTQTCAVAFFLAVIAIAGFMLHLPGSCWTLWRALTSFAAKTLGEPN